MARKSFEDQTNFVSTCLASGQYKYDAGEGVLTVQMVKPGGRGEYSYYLTPRQYRYLRDEAPSKGGYFNRVLKGNEI